VGTKNPNRFIGIRGGERGGGGDIQREREEGERGGGARKG